MPDIGLITEAVNHDSAFTEGAKPISGIHLEFQPSALPDGSVNYRAAAMMRAPSGHLFYRKFEIVIGGTPRAVERVTIAKEIAVGSMHFRITTGLIERMVLLEDVANDIRFVFPIGMGSIDDMNAEGKGVRFLTPLYQNAHIYRSTMVDESDEQPYYRHLPVIYIANRNGQNDGIAFHITLLSDKDWRDKGPNYLLRGIESHACMRLRYKDLREMFNIVKFGGSEDIPMNVNFLLWKMDPRTGRPDPKLGQEPALHPYPLHESRT